MYRVKLLLMTHTKQSLIKKIVAKRMQEIVDSIPAKEYNNTLEQMYSAYSSKSKDEIVLLYNTKITSTADQVTVEQVSDLIWQGWPNCYNRFVEG